MDELSDKAKEFMNITNLFYSKNKAKLCTFSE